MANTGYQRYALRQRKFTDGAQELYGTAEANSIDDDFVPDVYNPTACPIGTQYSVRLSPTGQSAPCYGTAGPGTNYVSYDPTPGVGTIIYNQVGTVLNGGGFWWWNVLEPGTQYRIGTNGQILNVTVCGI